MNIKFRDEDYQILWDLARHNKVSLPHLVSRIIVPDYLERKITKIKVPVADNGDLSGFAQSVTTAIKGSANSS